MSKGTYTGLQIAGMIVTICCAQGGIRLLLDHSKTPLWGALDWVPGGWGGQLLVLAGLIIVGVLLAGWAHDRAKERG